MFDPEGPPSFRPRRQTTVWEKSLLIQSLWMQYHNKSCAKGRVFHNCERGMWGNLLNFLGVFLPWAESLRQSKWHGWKLLFEQSCCEFTGEKRGEMVAYIYSKLWDSNCYRCLIAVWVTRCVLITLSHISGNIFQSNHHGKLGKKVAKSWNYPFFITYP